MISLRTQLEEARRMEEIMSNQLNERDLQCEILKAKIILARNELDEKKKLCKKLEKEFVSVNYTSAIDQR